MRKFIKSHSGDVGFTLIELLVVVSITGLLSSSVMAATVSAREKAKVAAARADLHQLRDGFSLYMDKYGQYPPQKYVNGVLTPADHCDFCSGQSGYGSYSLNTWNDVIDKLSAEDIMTGPRLDPWGRPYAFDNNFKQKCYSCNTSPLCSMGRDGIFESMGYYTSNPAESNDDICVFLEGN